MCAKISVIMSVYNTKEIYLREAIESILNQSFEEYQFIIINDGSNDETTKVLNEYQHKDMRIEIITNEKNCGLTVSLNIGLALARGQYIARMDSDDISYINRFQKQYRYMEKHPDIDILGGWVKVGHKIDKNLWRAGNKWRKVHMLFGNVGIYHPTAFIRKKFLDEHNIKYDEQIKKAQDYDLWCQCLNYGTIAVIPVVLLNYRVSNDQISIKNKDEQDYYRNIVRKKELDKIYNGYTDRELEQFLDMNKEILSAKELDVFWKKILDNNNKKKILDANMLKYKFMEEWIKIIIGKYQRKKKIEYISKKWLYVMISPQFWCSFINNRLLPRI